MGGGDRIGGAVGTSQEAVAFPAWTVGAEAASAGEPVSRFQGSVCWGCITVAEEGSGQWPGWWAEE